MNNTVSFLILKTILFSTWFINHFLKSNTKLFLRSSVNSCKKKHYQFFHALIVHQYNILPDSDLNSCSPGIEDFLIKNYNDYIAFIKLSGVVASIMRAFFLFLNMMHAKYAFFSRLYIINLLISMIGSS